jgi:hypothetical protein
MRIRRSYLFVLGGLSVVTLVTLLAIALVHVPAFALRAAEPSGAARNESSNEFFVRAGSFLATFAGGKGQWTYTFTQQQFNSYFQEDFIRFGDAERFRKVGIADPLIELDDDKIRLAFRYGEGSWSTILSYDLKAWVSSSEPNVIVIEFLRCRAGALPAPTQQVFQELTEVAQQHNIDIDWYRHEGPPLTLALPVSTPTGPVPAVPAPGVPVPKTP